MKRSKYDNARRRVQRQGVQGRAPRSQDVRRPTRRCCPSIQASAKKIGITFTVRTVKGAYPAIQTPSKNVPISTRPRWGKDYADPSTFFGPLFDGANIIPTGNTNYSLVGITPATGEAARRQGNRQQRAEHRQGRSTACAAKVGEARITCYAALDREADDADRAVGPVPVGEQVNVIGPNVTKWAFDQFAGTCRLRARMA